MSRIQFALAGAALVALLAVQSAFGADMLSGTWNINLAKSKYSPANLAPKSGTTRFEAVADGVKVITDGVDSQGRKTHTEYTAKFDGKEVPVKATIDGKPSPDQDGAAWKKIDDNTYEIATKLKGATLTTNHIVIAKDGKTRTNTVTGKNAQGQTVNNTVVYEKK